MITSTAPIKPFLRDIEFGDVLSVYYGKNGKCCCGCAGEYLYNSQHKEEGGTYRGYPVDDKDINDRQVRKVIGILRRAEKIEYDRPDFISTVVGERLYTVYFTAAAEERRKADVR